MTIRTSGVRTSVDPAALAGGCAGSRPSVLGDTGCRSGYLANQDWLRRTHAYGDLAIALLTLQALMAQRNNWAGALRLVWLFNTVGTVDPINSVHQQNVAPHLGGLVYPDRFSATCPGDPHHDICPAAETTALSHAAFV